MKFTEEEVLLAGANPKFLEIVKLARKLERATGKFVQSQTPQNFNRFTQAGRNFSEALQNLTDKERKQFMKNMERFIETLPDADAFRKSMEAVYATVEAFGKALLKKE